MTAKVLPKGSRPNALKPWTVRYWTADGTKQHEKSFAKERDARAFATKCNHESALGTFVEPSRELFGDAAQRWIDTRRPATRAKYQTILNNHLTPLTPRRLSAVANDRDAVQALTVNHAQGKQMLSIIRQTCQGAVNAGRLPAHRLTGLTCNTVGGVRELVLATPAQIDQMATALGSDGLAVRLMAGLGLRVSEVLALRSTDFMIGGMVRVSRQLSRDGSGVVPLKSRKSFADAKDIPVAPSLERLVRAHVSAHGDGDLFSVTYPTFSGRFRRAARAVAPFHFADGSEAPTELFTAHQLRHSFATSLLAHGQRLDLVSKWMGHADTRETSRVYAHLLSGDTGRARDILESDLFAGPVGSSGPADGAQSIPA